MRRSKGLVCILAVVGAIAFGCAQHKDNIFSAEPRISPMTHYYSGRVLQRQNDLLAAMHQYRKAIDADPKLVEAYCQLGILCQKLGRMDEAQQVLKQGIDENPESPVLRNNFGFCCLTMNDYVGAEQQFQAAIGLAPQFAQARMNLAIVLARTDRLTQSAAEFAHVVSPDLAYYNVAVICMDTEDYIQAEWALQNALAFNPDFAPAKADLPRVAVLAGQERERIGPAQVALNTGMPASAAEIVDGPPLELMAMPVSMKEKVADAETVPNSEPVAVAVNDADRNIISYSAMTVESKPEFEPESEPVPVPEAAQKPKHKPEPYSEPAVKMMTEIATTPAAVTGNRSIPMCQMDQDLVIKMVRVLEGRDDLKEPEPQHRPDDPDEDEPKPPVEPFYSTMTLIEDEEPEVSGTK